jgi:predicted amidohydrolase YtcJ
MRGLYCAVARKTRQGQPAGGWRPEQAVSLENALRHYTSDAAYATFDEADRGVLAVGRRGDLVVLSRDLFQEAPEAILQTKVLLTAVDGRVVHREAGF